MPYPLREDDLPDDVRQRLERLDDRLAGILAEEAVAAERDRDGVAIAGTDLVVAVTATWENPDPPPPGRPRTYGVRIGLRSPALFDEPALEYSYGVGLDDEAAAAAALRRWVELDCPVLVEAAAGEGERCDIMEIASDGGKGIAAGRWRLFLGPLNYIAGHEGAQPCCRACLATMSLPALMPLLTQRVSCAVKIVASKTEDGTTSADCRRNGQDLPEAIRAIAAAAGAWPTVPGTQTRRQYLYFKAPPHA